MTTIIILSIIFLVIDQISKILIIKLLEPNEVITIIKNFFYIIYTNNTGAAFSILLGKRIFLIVVAILIIGILFYIKKNKVDGKLNIIAFSLIIGGSLGNLIDRIVRGYVVDFISIKLGSYNFPIFNIADTLIVVGVFLLLIGNTGGNKNDNR